MRRRLPVDPAIAEFVGWIERAHLRLKLWRAGIGLGWRRQWRAPVGGVPSVPAALRLSAGFVASPSQQLADPLVGRVDRRPSWRSDARLQRAPLARPGPHIVR
jgi:hypothetical protein